MLIVIVIIVLFASLVLLHEWGHFIAARRGGVEVEEFGFGFPPRIWSKTVGGTRYSINLLPLGGFVSLKGEDNEDRRPGSFAVAKYATRAKILLAGVGMNLLTAIVILYGLCLTGLPALGSGFEPTFLRSTYAQPKQEIMAQVEKGSPADRAGIHRGDYVLSSGGETFTNDQSLRDFTKEHAGQKVTFVVLSSGVKRNVTVTLRSPGSNQGYLGVVSQQVYKLRYDPLNALVAAVYVTGALFVATIVGVFELIIHIPNLIIDLFSSSVPQAAQAASGPVGIFLILTNISVLGYAYIFLFMANIAVALAAFNVLPLPALDGGRLAIISLQRFWKVKVSSELEAKIHSYGFMALIGLMVVISVYDLRKNF
jgi:regulator of sigma E protease